MPGRLPEEDVLLVAGDALSASQTKTYRDIFPLSGEGWRKLRLSFHHVVGAGGTVPNPLGAYRFIKGVNIRTSRNENPVSTPGMGLYLLNYLMNGIEPVYTTVVAGALTFHCNIDIPFTFPFIGRKEDLSIDSGRYTMIELELQTGTLADMQRTPAAATLASTVDISLVRNKSGFYEGGKPVAMPYIKHLTPFQAVTKGYVDIESAEDLILFGFIAMANDLVTWGTVGNPYDGTPVDLMTDISFEDNLMSWVKTKKVDSFQEDRAHYSNSRTLAGVYPYLFTKEGSYKGGYPTGGRSEIKLKIGNGAYVAATTPQVDVILIGSRTLR